MLRIGLTGGIGSGKSTVANYFAELGIKVIDADVIAHQLTETKQPALIEIREHFGEPILNADKTLNRKRLSEIVFNQPNEKKWLENLLHPLIRQQIQNQIEQAQSPYVVLVIPLLAETQHLDYIDRILVVDAPTQLQLQRAMQRDQADEAKIKSIIESQAPREQRLKMANDVIVNDSDLTHLKQATTALHQKYLNL